MPQPPPLFITVLRALSWTSALLGRDIVYHPSQNNLDLSWRVPEKIETTALKHISGVTHLPTFLSGNRPVDNSQGGGAALWEVITSQSKCLQFTTEW